MTSGMKEPRNRIKTSINEKLIESKQDGKRENVTKERAEITVFYSTGTL